MTEFLKNNDNENTVCYNLWDMFNALTEENL